MKEYEVISIPVSDGTEKEFAIKSYFTVDEQDYIAVSLVDGDIVTEEEYIYRYQTAEDEDLIVETISTPAEFKHVTREYQKMSVNE